MTPEKLAELEALCEKATKGPWVVDAWRIEAPGRLAILEESLSHRSVLESAPEGWTKPEDMELAAASREAIPALIAEVRRLQNEAAKEAYIADVYRRKAEGLEAENAELRREA